MKRKYHGLLSASFILLALSGTVLFAMNASWETTGKLYISRLKPLPEIIVPSPAEIQEMEQLEKRMPGLVSPPKSEPTDVNLTLFGYQPMGSPRMVVHGKQTTYHVPADYSLTFAFSSGKKRFCIVDGSFYSEGSNLPGGGKILKIEPKRVLVREHHFDRWIRLAEKTPGGERERTIEKTSQ